MLPSDLTTTQLPSYALQATLITPCRHIYILAWKMITPIQQEDIARFIVNTTTTNSSAAQR